MAASGTPAWLAWTSVGGVDHFGEVTSEEWTATGAASVALGSVMEEWTAEGLVVFQSPANGAPEWERWTAAGTLAAMPYLITGSASFEKWTAAGYTPLAASVEVEAWTAAGRVRNNITGAVEFEAWRSDHSSGFVRFEVWTAQGVVSVAIAETYLTAAMNTRTKAVTEYTNFPFNSFARIGNDYYAAGPSGIFRLGDSSTDNGTAIQWAVKTGQLDDKTFEHKRVTQVMLGLRSSGPVRVRVHPGDAEYHEYVLPMTRADTIHQQRVKTGKGMRSRWYAIELRGVNGSDLELASMEVDTALIKRRIG